MLLSTAPVRAYAENSLVLEVQSVTAACKAGETVKVPVKALANDGYAAGTLDVSYDSTALRLTGVSYTALAPDNGSAAVTDTGSYRIAFGDYLAEADFTETGTFFTLEFAITDAAVSGNYTIALTDTGIYSKAVERVKTTLDAGTVTLTDGGSSEITVAAKKVTADAAAGTEVKMPVSVTVNPGYAVGSLDVKWNNAALTLKDVEYTAPAINPAPITNSGKYRVSFGDYLATENYTGKSVLFTLVFEVAEGAEAGTYPIRLAMPDFRTADIEKLTVILKNGSAVLEEPETTTVTTSTETVTTTTETVTTTTETVTTTTETVTTTTETVTTTTETVTTSTETTETVSESTSSETVTESTSSETVTTSDTESTSSETSTTEPSGVSSAGDCDGNGRLEVADAVLLLRFVTEDSKLSKKQVSTLLKGKPDVDADGLVTISDVAALLRLLAET